MLGHTESTLAPDPATAAMSGRMVAETMTGANVSSLRTLRTAPGSVVYVSEVSFSVHPGLEFVLLSTYQTIFPPP